MVDGGIFCWKIELEKYVAEVFFSLQFFSLIHQVFSPKLLSQSACLIKVIEAIKGGCGGYS
jgi:hypothetical protein